MKETFLKFQLPKEKMNEVRGGSTQICHCGGSTNEFRVEGTDGSYDELENEGYILTRQGKGSFVAPKNLELAKEQKRKEIEDYIEKIVDISKNYNISKKEVTDLFEYLWRNEE